MHSRGFKNQRGAQNKARPVGLGPKSSYILERFFGLIVIVLILFAIWWFCGWSFYVAWNTYEPHVFSGMEILPKMQPATNILGIGWVFPAVFRNNDLPSMFFAVLLFLGVFLWYPIFIGTPVIACYCLGMFLLNAYQVLTDRDETSWNPERWKF